MTKILKALVKNGRFSGETVRVTNISLDEMGRHFAACILSDSTRANIRVDDLELLEEKPEPEPIIKHARTASMPFLSGSSSSRTLTHTKNMSKKRMEKKAIHPSGKTDIAKCETCGENYNREDRKGKAGKLTDCENCAEETETMVEGTMVFSHKTGATIEIKKDGQLKHEAQTFDPKNKT